MSYDLLLLKKLGPFKRSLVADIIHENYDNKFFMRWVNFARKNLIIAPCPYDSLASSEVYTILAKQNLDALADIIWEYPESHAARVVCFDIKLIKKLTPIHVIHIHAIVNFRYQNTLLMQWVNLDSVKKI